MSVYNKDCLVILDVSLEEEPNKIEMLEIRPTCENCNKRLPFDSKDAMICTFECTFCLDCVNNLLKKVCPNCGGVFQKRPIRPKGLLEKYPVSDTIIYKPVDLEKHQEFIKKLM